jgi:uncharacterized protein
MGNMTNRYYDLNTYFRETYGCRVQKIAIDAGLSCPNRDGTFSSRGCIYCNSRGSGTGNHAKGLSVKNQVEQGMAFLSRRYQAKKFIAYFQSFTNTYAPLDQLKQLYDEALSVEGVVGLSIGTRPDCVNEPVLSLLEGYGRDHLVWIEYGLQSAHDKTLSLLNRGHDAGCFMDAVSATKNRGIKICAHVILGLPGETRQDILETADFISEAGVDGVKIHLLYVVKETRLEILHQSGQYTCLTQNEYVSLVCDFLERLPKDVVIQRLTGDPHPDELAAPLWSLQKSKTLSLIHDLLVRRNSFQGKYSRRQHR